MDLHTSDCAGAFAPEALQAWLVAHEELTALELQWVRWELRREGAVPAGLQERIERQRRATERLLAHARCTGCVAEGPRAGVPTDSRPRAASVR